MPTDSITVIFANTGRASEVAERLNRSRAVAFGGSAEQPVQLETGLEPCGPRMLPCPLSTPAKQMSLVHRHLTFLGLNTACFQALATPVTDVASQL